MRPNSNAPSDTLSEISEASTTGTERSSCYSDYRDELQEFATSLGFKNADELYFERFKVDRKRLEAMLLGNAECASSAQEFFQKIMDDTQTLIKWPTQLKIGAKSKKDPNVKIYGLERNVNMAKQTIMAVLDTRVGHHIKLQTHRVTMKLDVSYTDHSHIIGKGGLRIKRVMEETGCHIHFPDSNRNNEEEKSNQVSIAGAMLNIEQARARVRELTPLIFCFELPHVGTLKSFPELNSPLVLGVQETYNVQVMCRTRAKLHPTMVMVKGCEWEVNQVIEATQILINHMCDDFANQATVQMMMEISPQYHGLVLGAEQQNLKRIMQHTGVQIMFPDPSDPYTPTLKRSSVIISGLIHKVYSARQMLLGSLPLVLMFDYVSDTAFVNSGLLESIMKTNDVYISVRPKPKPNVFSVIIKGLERNATNIYEARRRLIGLKKTEPVIACIPAMYKTPGPVPTFMNSFLSVGTHHPSHHHPRPPSSFTFPLHMMIKPLLQQRAAAAAAAAASAGSGSPLKTGTPSTTPSSLDFHNTINTPRTPVNQSPHHTPMQQKYNGWSVNDMLQSLGCMGLTQQKTFPYYPPVGISSSINELKDSPISAYASCISSDTSSLSASPRTASPISSLTDSCGKLELNELSERKAPGFERSSASQGGLNEYQQLRIQAAQAMQGMPNNTEIRVPTQNWSGYGFSHSSPSSLTPSRIKEDTTLTNCNTDDQFGISKPNQLNDSMENDAGSNKGSNTRRFAVSNYLDAAASSTFNVVTSSNYSDLPSHMASLGLQKYIQLFKAHEIDLSTFQTLNEADLKEIGVTALGARRKMMLFISELKKREQMNVFRGSAAPGAERGKISSCTSSPQNDNSW